MAKIKDLDPKTNLGHLKVKTDKGVIGTWEGQWERGVWLHIDGEREGKITPIFVDDLKEVLEWEVIE
jgi:hypothetical protein